MALFDFCNMTFLISATVSVFIIISVYGYITYKMSEQDHKISTMLGIISSMAQEQEFLRNKVTNKVGGNGEVCLESNNSFGNCINTCVNTCINKRIEVSDDDDDDEDDGEDENTSNSDSDDEDDEDDDDEDDSGDDEENEEKYSQKKFNIHLGNDEDIENVEHTVETFSDDESSIDSSSESETGSNSSDMTKITNITNVKTIHLEDPINIKEDTLPFIQSNNLDFLKTLHITDSEELDYKKMPVQKLRSIILEKGIVEDPSKLKKPELLKLIEGL